MQIEALRQAVRAVEVAVGKAAESSEKAAAKSDELESRIRKREEEQQSA